MERKYPATIAGPGRFAAQGVGPPSPRQAGSGERVQGPALAPRPPPPSRSFLPGQPDVLHRRIDRATAPGGGAVRPAAGRCAQTRAASGHPGPGPLLGPVGATRPWGQTVVLEVVVAPGLAGPRGRPDGIVRARLTQAGPVENSSSPIGSRRPLCPKNEIQPCPSDKTNLATPATDEFITAPAVNPCKGDGSNC